MTAVAIDSRARLDAWLPRLILLAAGGYFAMMAGRWIASPGLQYDEVLFVNAATGEPNNGLFVAKRILGLPVMLMGYIGALKAYLYYPVFQVFGVSPATIRWPVIIASLVTLALTYRVARFSFDRSIAALVVLVMSVDPTFMYLTKLDYGPVALMMVLKLTALFFGLRAVSTGSPEYFWGMSGACALGLFDKLNFIWFLLALVVAGGALFRTELGEMWRRVRFGLLLPLSTVVVVTGLAMAVLVLPQLAASQAAATPVSPLDRIGYVARIYASTMNGQEFYSLVTKRALPAGSLMNPVVALGFAGLAVAGLLAARRVGGGGKLPFGERVLLCHLGIFLLIAVQVLVTKKAWGPHHIMMLYPFQLFVAFGAAMSLTGRLGAAVVAAALVASGLHVGAAYERAFRPTGEFEPHWSPVVYQLVDYLNHHQADRIVSVDWGTHNQIWALGSVRTRAISRDRWPEFRTLGDSTRQELLYRRDFEGMHGLAILHAPGWDIMPSVRPNFLAWSRAFGLVLRLERVFASPAGTVVYEVYAVDGSQSKAGDRTSAPKRR